MYLPNTSHTRTLGYKMPYLIGILPSNSMFGPLGHHKARISFVSKALSAHGSLYVWLDKICLTYTTHWFPISFITCTSIYRCRKPHIHPYRHPAARTTLRLRTNAEYDDDDLYLRETATSTSQALPTQTCRKVAPVRTSSIPSASFNEASTAESVVDCSQETEEPVTSGYDVDNSYDRSTAPVSQNNSCAASLRSNTFRNRRLLVSQMSGNRMIADLSAVDSQS
jgi:hypothetical protein